MSVAFAVTPCGRGRLPLPEDAARVGAMRRVVTARLRYCGLATMSDAVTVAVSELLTNSILHSGGTSITLLMVVEDDALRVSVADGMPGRATPRDAGADEESGRGLQLLDFLVQEHAGSWGTSATGDETWCRFALPGGGAR
jgi:anti-sigma regulatory factor (Ser/Thr protein kinase)